MLLNISRHASNRIKFEIENTTEHTITLQGRAFFGRLELTASITHLAVKLKSDTGKAKDVCTNIHEWKESAKISAIQVFSAEQSSFLNQFELSNFTFDQRKHTESLLTHEQDTFSSEDDLRSAKEWCVSPKKLRHPTPLCGLRVKDTMENLSGNKWFSLLNQGKNFLNYLGQVVLEERYKTDNSNFKVSNAEKFSTKNCRWCQTCSRVVELLSKYIEKFAQIAKPLFELTQRSKQDCAQELQDGRKQKGQKAKQNQVSSRQPVKSTIKNTTSLTWL